MPRFERTRERSGSRDSRGGSSRGNSRGRSSFGDRDSSDDRGRGSFGGRGRRDSGRSDRGPRRDVQMTKVTCSSCGEKCEVPFKPTSSKPVYCNDCFSKEGKSSSGRGSNNNSSKDLDTINEKLDKIMRFLKID